MHSLLFTFRLSFYSGCNEIILSKYSNYKLLWYWGSHRIANNSITFHKTTEVDEGGKRIKANLNKDVLLRLIIPWFLLWKKIICNNFGRQNILTHILTVWRVRTNWHISLLLSQDLASKKCPKTNKPCGQHALCWGVKRAESNPAWYAPSSLAELAAIFTANPDSTFRLIGGDTGRGENQNIYIDLIVYTMWHWFVQVCTRTFLR